jgi:hypothetical protein
MRFERQQRSGQNGSRGNGRVRLGLHAPSARRHLDLRLATLLEMRRERAGVPGATDRETRTENLGRRVLVDVDMRGDREAAHRRKAEVKERPELVALSHALQRGDFYASRRFAGQFEAPMPRCEGLTA